jgi:hypothetical protein
MRRTLGAVNDRSIPTWPVAAGALILGFGVAELTGVRAIGGVVLFLGALWCGLRWKAMRGLTVSLSLVFLFLALFVISHVLGHQIGAWPSVFVVSAAMAVATWFAADRSEAPPLIDAV